VGRRELRAAGRREGRSRANADGSVDSKAPETKGGPRVDEVKTTERTGQTGAGTATNKKAAEKVAPGSSGGTVAGQGQGEPVPKATATPEPGAPDPTEDRPARKPRKATARDTKSATEPKPRRPRKPKGPAA